MSDPSVFNIKSSISVHLLLKSWLISINNEKERPEYTVHFNPFVFGQIKGKRTPSGTNNKTLRKYATISMSCENGVRVQLKQPIRAQLKSPN